MDKKFLSAEEAIEQFGLDPVQFQQMIDEGEVRALQDRDTWKYRRDEIEGLIRDGLLSSSVMGHSEEPQTLEFDAPSVSSLDEFSFLNDDDEALPEGATMIRKSSDDDFADGLDEVLVVPDDEEIIVLPDEDETLPAASAPAAAAAEEEEFDEDVIIVAEDDTPTMVDQLRLGDSNSEVTIVPDEVDSAAPATVDLSDSASEVTLIDDDEPSGVGSDSEIVLIDDDSQINPAKPPTPPTGMPVAETLNEFDMLTFDEPQLAAPASATPAEEPVFDPEMFQFGEPQIAMPQADLPVAESLSEFDLVLTDPTAESSAKQPHDSSVILGVDEEATPDSDSDVKVLSDAASSSGLDLGRTTDHVIPTGDSVISLAESSGVQTSDSDVRIADSGISLERTDAGFAIDSGLTLESSAVLASGSGVRPDDSGISLEPVDSGLTLEAAVDSGITLEDNARTMEMAADSGLTLEAADSGIALEGVMDSGISLEGDDSGLSLGGDDSGIALAGKKAGRRPAPDETQAEFDEIDEGATFEYDSANEQTAMIALDDEDAVETLPPKKGAKAKPGLSQTFEDIEVEDLEIAEDLDAGELDVEAVDDEDFAEDVLDASDEAFTMEEAGESSEDVSAASMPSMKMVAAKEPAWGVVAVLPVAACALLLLVQGLILWDGVSTMWTGDDTAAMGKGVIDALGGIL